MKKALCAAAASLLMASCFAGCGDKSEDKKSSSDFLGKWECQSMNVSGMKSENENLHAAIQLEIKSDGTYTAKSAISSLGSSGSGKWKEVDSDTITFDLNGNTAVLDLVDGKLVQKTEQPIAFECVYAKVTEFSTLSGNVNLNDIMNGFDLSGFNMNGIDLSGLNIDGLNLDGIDLSGIDLSGLMQ